jgi:hypothetical protein
MSKSVFDSTLSKHLVMDDIDANNAVAKFPARYSFDPLPAAATDPFSITVGASPFAFSNRTAGKVEVMISGGTVSSITHTRQGANGPITSATGMTNGTVLTSSGDTITVTYSVAPTMAAVPHA